MTVRCFDDGYLVGMQHLLPTASTERYVEGGPFFGCNHVACDRCHEVVRHIDSRVFAKPLAPAERDLLYDRLDAASPLVTAGGDGYRLYLCKCTYVAIAGVSCLEIADHPWRCAGHPI